jgi:pimeloyl-ACP methyl ester carboxylesterase
MKIVIFALIAAVCSATEFETVSVGLQKRLLIRAGLDQVTPARSAHFVYPATYRIGSLRMVRCLTDNMYGIDGIYCWNQTVRLNRYAPADERQIKVAFMVHVPPQHISLKPRDAREALWFPLGGPGSVAHLSMEYFYGWAMTEPRTWASMDVIMYDQRGMGWSCGMSCWDAYVQYNDAGNYSTDVESLADAAQDFRRACEIEIGSDKIQAAASDECIVGSRLSPRAQRLLVVPFQGTKHAVADFEDFRLAAGYGRVHAVGSSYGTIAVQTYAGMFPNSVKTLMIDSPFDTLTDISISARREASGRRGTLARLAEICAADPECAADACPSGENCASTINSIFANAVAAANWPRTVSYPYFDMNTGEYTVTPIAFPSDWFELAMSGAMTRLQFRSQLIRAMLRLGSGDDAPAMHTSIIAVYYMNPSAPSFPVEYAMAAGANQATSYPMVTGEDYTFHWGTHPVLTTAEIRQAQYIEAYGLDQYAMPLGISPIMFNLFIPAYGSPLPPVYSDAHQNSSMTPTIGWHGNFPVIILNPSHDSNCPTDDANILDAAYSAQVGQTRRITLADGEHCVLLSTIPDAVMPQVQSVIDGILVSGTLPPAHSTTFSLERNMFDYRPRATAPLAIDSVLAAAENEFVMLVEWAAYYNVIASCDKGGFVYWGTMINETHEAITFVNCGFVDPNFVVNGIAAYNWATPALYDTGADFGFDMAAVTDLTTGNTNYYSYLHLSGMPVSQVSLPAPSSRSIRSDPFDHSAAVSQALQDLYLN